VDELGVIMMKDMVRNKLLVRRGKRKRTTPGNGKAKSKLTMCLQFSVSSGLKGRMKAMLADCILGEKSIWSVCSRAR
jgi:hypothetical protein